MKHGSRGLDRGAGGILYGYCNVIGPLCHLVVPFYNFGQRYWVSSSYLSRGDRNDMLCMLIPHLAAMPQGWAYPRYFERYAGLIYRLSKMTLAMAVY